MIYSPARIDGLRTAFLGKRVRLIRTTDPYTELKYGDEGVIDFIDDEATFHVNWDNGSRLGLIDKEDRWEVLD